MGEIQRFSACSLKKSGRCYWDTGLSATAEAGAVAINRSVTKFLRAPATTMAKRSTGAAQSTPAFKKRKTSKRDNSSNGASLSAVVDLEKKVGDAIAAGASLNPLADLLKIACSADEGHEVVLKAIFAVYRLLVQILRKGLLRVSGEEGSKGKVVRTWIMARLDSFADLLSALLKDEERTLRVRNYLMFCSLLPKSSLRTDIRFEHPILLASRVVKQCTCPRLRGRSIL